MQKFENFGAYLEVRREMADDHVKEKRRLKLQLLHLQDRCEHPQGFILFHQGWIAEEFPDSKYCVKCQKTFFADVDYHFPPHA